MSPDWMDAMRKLFHSIDLIATLPQGFSPSQVRLMSVRYTRALSLAVLVMVLMWLSPAMQAQSLTGSLQGTVTDQAGAVVQGARIGLRSTSAQVTQETVSDSQGQFSLKNLPAGEYTLVIEKKGFQPRQQTIAMTSDLAPMTLTLTPETLSEVVMVTDNSIAVESTFKLETSIHETPRAVTIIDSTRIREQNFRFVNDAFAYVPGVAVNSYRTGGYHFYARGYRMLPDDTRVDGFAGINAGGRYGATLFGVEQAVLLRGPAGLLYGSSGAPGGMINLITKKPQPVQTTRIDLRAGGFAGNGVGLTERGFGGLDIDTTGPVGKTDRVFYRALFTIENMNYFTNNVLDRNRYAQGSLTFKLDQEGRYTLTPMFQWTRFNRPAGGGIVISPTTSLSTNDKISGPVNTRDLSPLDVNLSFGGGIDEGRQAGFDFRAIPVQALRINLGYRFIGLDTSINQFTPVASTPTQIEILQKQNLVQRQQTKSETDRLYHNFDFNTAYEFQPTSWWKNTVQVGGYARLSRTRTTTNAGPLPAPQSFINIYTGQTTTPLVDNYPALKWADFIDTTFWNTYVQNRAALANGKVIFSFGLGYGQNHPGGVPVRKGEVTPNLSLVYNVDHDLALFFSYATSYNPADANAEDITGKRNTFDPSIGRNYEFGAKYDLPNRRASATLSFFHNEVTNALVQSGPNDLNPNGNRYFVEAGSRRARGIELSTEFQPVRDLRVTAAVSYLDAIYTGDGPASAAPTNAIPGSRAEKSPKWSYSVWSRYDRTEGKFQGFGAGLGLIWQDERLGGNGARTPTAPDPLLLPAFTRLDAALFYRWNEHIDFALNFENLTDRVIFVSGTVGSGLEIAPPRTVSFRMGYRF